MQIDADANLPRKRRVPRPANSGNVNENENGGGSGAGSGPFGPSFSEATTAGSSTLVNSRFFAGSERSATPSTTQTLARVLSPVRGPPIDIDDEDEDDEPLPSRNTATASTMQASRQEQGPTQTNKKTRADISFEEFDFPSDDSLDAAFLD